MKEKKLFVIMLISIILTLILGLVAFVLTQGQGDCKLYCSAATCSNCTEKECDCYYCEDDECLTTKNIKCPNKFAEQEN